MSVKRLVLHLVLTASLALGSAACRDSSGAASEGAAETESGTAPAPRLEGEVFAAGGRQRVLPFITHPPDMDLRNQCRHAVDDAKKAIEAGNAAAKVPPLCFDREVRPLDALSLKVLRLEHRAGMTTPEAMAILRTGGDGAHFLVEATGSIYQTLDLAYAARRGDVPRRDEVRVLSGSAAGHAKLVAALTGLYPALKVHEVVAPPKPDKVEGPKGAQRPDLPLKLPTPGKHPEKLLQLPRPDKPAGAGE